MLRVTILTATLGLMSLTSLASFTVYQGRSGHVLGTCDTARECRAILRKHQGFGESIVNNETGMEVKAPGRSGFGHKQGKHWKGKHKQGKHSKGNHRQGNHGQGNHGHGNHGHGNHGHRH